MQIESPAHWLLRNQCKFTYKSQQQILQSNLPGEHNYLVIQTIISFIWLELLLILTTVRTWLCFILSAANCMQPWFTRYQNLLPKPEDLHREQMDKIFLCTNGYLDGKNDNTNDSDTSLIIVWYIDLYIVNFWIKPCLRNDDNIAYIYSDSFLLVQ